MTAALAPHVIAMADAIEAAARFSDLYGQNAFVMEYPTVSGKVRRALHGGDEAYSEDRQLAHNYALVGLRTVPVRPGTPRADVDALLAAAVPAVGTCDQCPWPSTPLVGLLPVPAGAVVVALLLCEECWQSKTTAMPTAHFIRSARG